MEPDARCGQMAAAAPRPLAEVLQCPPPIASLLSSAARRLSFEPGEAVFLQSGNCRGLYLVVSGQFQRRAERAETQFVLGPVRAGALVELAAALAGGRHTYTLSAVTFGSVILVPIEELQGAFQEYPPLRMQLLMELAREVSRGYLARCDLRISKARREGREVPGR
jgi:CRP-like cAMP-binding protein